MDQLAVSKNAEQKPVVSPNDMEAWFADYALDPSLIAGDVPDETIARIERQFGPGGDIQAQLRIMSDALLHFADEDQQVTFMLYICGHSQETIDRQGSASLDETIAYLDTLLPPPSEKVVKPVRRIGKATVAIVYDNIPQDDDDTKPVLVEDNDVDEVLRTVPMHSYDPVKDYLQKIGRTPLLNAEQEVELGIAIEVGLFARERLDTQSDGLSATEKRELLTLEATGQRAYERMMNANLRLVVSVAKHYAGREMSFLDLIQEGNLGLLRAVQKFDYKKGFKFSTYGTWWIRQSITRAIADQARTIRIPVHMGETISKINKARNRLTITLGRSPTDEELAADVDITPQKLTEINRYSLKPMSLNTTLGDDGETEFGDLVEDADSPKPDDAADVHFLRKDLGVFLDAMAPREAIVIRMRYGLDGGEPATLDAIGEVLGLTRERVRQIEAVAIKKLRANTVLSTKLQDYLKG